MTNDAVPTTRRLVYVRLLPIKDTYRPWKVECDCGFAREMASYASTYSLADQHRLGHADRAENPAGPSTVGGYLAVSAEAGESALAAARTLWLAFDEWCNDVGWTDRKHDPEAWDIWLTGRNGGSNEALIFEWWEALRASGMATGLRRLTAAPDWQDRSFAIALDLLRADDVGSLLLVTAADGLTLDHLVDLVGDRKDELPGLLRKRLEPPWEFPWQADQSPR